MELNRSVHPPLTTSYWTFIKKVFWWNTSLLHGKGHSAAAAAEHVPVEICIPKTIVLRKLTQGTPSAWLQPVAHALVAVTASQPQPSCCQPPPLQTQSLPWPRPLLAVSQSAASSAALLRCSEHRLSPVPPPVSSSLPASLCTSTLILTPHHSSWHGRFPRRMSRDSRRLQPHSKWQIWNID